MAKRRRFSAEFKARVALEALVGDKTLAELAARHDVHPNIMIAQWKRQAKESLPDGTVNLSGLLAHKALAGDEDAQIQGACEPLNGHSGVLFGSS